MPARLFHGTKNFKLGKKNQLSELDLVFSDIHADLNGLELIIQTASSDEFVKKYGSFSRIINLGDLLERGIYPKQVISKLRSLEQN
jgi:hypothetical protein